MKLSCLLILSCVTLASAQTAPALERPGVRRFSAGGVLTFTGFPLIENRNLTEGSAKYGTKNRGSRFGGGGTAQFAFLSRYALAGSVLLRRAQFESNNELPVTGGTAKQNEFASADFWELPIVFRRFSKDHAESGARWFAEGGVALRYTANIRNSVQSTSASDRTTCCDERGIPAQNQFAPGVTVGAGYQLVDQFGLRLIPQIRYTRWLSPTFDRLSLRSNPNQLEAGFAITF